MTTQRRTSRTLALAAASALALAACGTAQDDPTTDQFDDPRLEEGAPIPEDGLAEDDAVFANPGDHIGQQVVIDGEIGVVYSPTVFELLGDLGQASILVVGAPETTLGELEMGGIVQVTGFIQGSFDPDTLELNEAEREGVDAWRGNPYLEAIDVQVHLN